MLALHLIFVHCVNAAVCQQKVVSLLNCDASVAYEPKKPARLESRKHAVPE